jgi:hypothetical protein
MREIVVRNGTWGWMLEVDTHAEYFRTGAQAERRARDLAGTLAAQGESLTVRLHDLQDRPFAVLNYPAAASAAA